MLVNSDYAYLEKVMDEQNLDGFLLPRADEYQSEYLPRSSQRLAWLTGFDGSAGFAIVLARCAQSLLMGATHCR